MITSKAQIKANRKWNEENLDRIYLTVKKGNKEVIKQHAINQGETLNGYILKSIEMRMNKE